MKKQFLTKVLPAAVMAACFTSPAQATNWLMLQGTERADQAPRAKLWGFVQLDYQQTDDTKLKAGPYAGKSAAFNQMAPQLDTPSGFNVKRARIGVRGNNLPLDKKVNYFLLAEMGNNGVTTGEGASQGQLTDASVTLNHIPGARVRVGLFKTPGSEEGLQAAFVANYNNFSNATNRLLLERTFDYQSGNTGRNGPVGAFRDTGVQVFDTFNLGGWETSYAVMIGNGAGLAYTDNDQNRDTYLYASTEKVFGSSKGPRRHGFKLYAWNQAGQRSYNDGTPSSSGADTDEDRTRRGVGTTYFDGTYRLGAEYMTADGMIYGGTTGAGTPDDGATFTVLPDQKADGYYVSLGYRPMSNVELDVRYDRLNSGTDKNGTGGAGAKRVFETTTLGAQYFFNKKTTLKANYEIRSIDAPNSNDTVNRILDSIDDRISLQLTAVF
ncbi:porin [Thiomicrospira sp. WB1]|uniref:porin n=1 Tax=Thiomicrospira sp. WB1 TaxID=1685380 RepID=UPI00074A3E87|nr:porin [Thiomicrospira sp. WB1]KUJ72679.1 porin [Thiomicrospira sp. WB1]